MEKKQTTQIIIMVAGIIVLVVVMGNNMSKVKLKTASSSIESVVKTAFQKTAPKKEEPGKAASENDKQWGRDPFTLKEIAAGKAVEESISNLTLEGITAGAGKKPSAIINNEIVKVGSKVGRFTVLGIKKDRVTVADDKDRIELLLDR